MTEAEYATAMAKSARQTMDRYHRTWPSNKAQDVPDVSSSMIAADIKDALRDEGQMRMHDLIAATGHPLGRISGILGVLRKRGDIIADFPDGRDAGALWRLA